MPTYKITIVRTEQNPNYEQEMKEYKENLNRMNNYNGRLEQEAPLREFSKDTLVCELSDEQFKKVKKEVLSVFE